MLCKIVDNMGEDFSAGVSHVLYIFLISTVHFRYVRGGAGSWGLSIDGMLLVACLLVVLLE